jgi:energy-coupling factor transporter ATP-binding protein EcfA2
VCLLDEVDAPLDDANLDRFLSLVRHFSERTQFIVITHNKKSMEMADRLFGVTMEEPGISKIVSVSLDGRGAELGVPLGEGETPTVPLDTIVGSSPLGRSEGADPIGAA